MWECHGLLPVFVCSWLQTRWHWRQLHWYVVCLSVCLARCQSVTAKAHWRASTRGMMRHFHVINGNNRVYYRAFITVCLSVCPSDKRELCDETKEHTADILIPHKRVISLVFWYQQRLVGDVPFHLEFALKVTHPLWKMANSTNICLWRLNRKS